MAIIRFRRIVRRNSGFGLLFGILFLIWKWGMLSYGEEKWNFKLNKYEDVPILNSVANYPIDFYTSLKNTEFPKINDSCATFPSIEKVSFHNVNWQIVVTTNEILKLYSAYYDNRELLRIKPIVRILGMVNTIKPHIKTNCQLWFKNIAQPIFSEVIEYNRVSSNSDASNMSDMVYLITCKIPNDYSHKIPEAVSLVEHPCDHAHNILKVKHNIPIGNKKKDFGVCVKGFTHRTKLPTVKLIEWFELLFLLGADKVFMYDFNINPEFSIILNYYESKGRVEMSAMTLPGYNPNAPGLLQMYLDKNIHNRRNNEALTYMDCFYNNIYQYKYIVILDVDQIIMPKSTKTWKEMIATISAKYDQEEISFPSTLYVRHVYFLDYMTNSADKTAERSDIPEYMHMSNNIFRSEIYLPSPKNVKAFHNTDNIIVLNKHNPVYCIPFCKTISMNTEDVQLSHYSDKCKFNCNMITNKTVEDTLIWRYKSSLVSNVNTAMQDLNLVTREIIL